MKTHTQETKTQPDMRERECLPCDLPPFCRNNYFTGKLLTARDLTDEQRYLIGKSRLHNLALHGWGVVCGLKVKPHRYCPDQRIVVEPGLAIDTCGREIWVPQEIELKLPPPETPPHKRAERHKAHRDCDDQEGMSWDTEKEPDQNYDQDQKDQWQKPDQEPEHCEPGPEPITLYVCLSYAECDSEMMPAPFDECACTSSQQQPNRICEGYHLEILTEEPKGLDQIRERLDPCGQDDCRELYQSMLECCPAPSTITCLPLAVIYNFVPGQDVTEEMINNREFRPLLPSAYLLDQLVRCILDKLPTKQWTQITDFNWTHNKSYDCDDFHRIFIGGANYPKGFEVSFSRPLHPNGITPRTFQAIVIRYAEWPSRAGHPEVAPATVRLSDDGYKAYLDIDPNYAHRRLERANFDLYLLLRCNLILDERGDAVDGDLLAQIDSDGDYTVDAPTGNGMPGGLFESWIRVRT